MGTRTKAWLAVFILGMGGAMAASEARESKGDEKAVRAATEQFYAALNTMFTGELGPMKDVWSHAGDVTYMGPAGGLQVGWNQVLKEWEAGREVSIRATNLFRKEHGTWKMIGHHTDLLPFLNQ